MEDSDLLKPQLGPDVSAALERGQPVVALESTVLAHGLPVPQSLDTSRRLQEIVIKAGAMPATIGILSGRSIVGLTAEQIHELVISADTAKITPGDIGPTVALGLTGATTVGATIRLAAEAGIGVMATGGIGGVHRQAQTDLDISADLPALASTPIVVVCSGPKTLLDAALTLQWLETNGVCVLGYGTEEMPLFLQRSSGLALAHSTNEVSRVARVAAAHWASGLRSAVLVCVPVPPHRGLRAEELDPLVERALREARDSGTRGKDLTPFVLARLRKLSGNRTLTANIALLENNTLVAAQVAMAMKELEVRPPS